MATPKLNVVAGELVGRGAPPDRQLPYVTRLHDMQSLKRDALKVYRAARKGQIPTDEMSRFMYAVDKVGNVIEKADVEPRLDALEQRLLALSEMLDQRR
jgi:hypothetical protein